MCTKTDRETDRQTERRTDGHYYTEGVYIGSDVDRSSIHSHTHTHTHTHTHI